MKLYSVHVRRFGLDPRLDVVLIKEGFSWPAALFGPLWAIAKGHWLVGAALVGVLLVVSVLEELLGADPVAQAFFSLGFTVILGFVANDLQRWSLKRRGYRFDGVSSGDGNHGAFRRYLDARPDLAQALM